MSAQRTASALAKRLYAWLAEPDPQRFERAFAAYFSVAFPAVLRYLARLSRWDPKQLEELAQDALLRFFDKAGRARREASELVKATLPAIRPLKMGPIHERQVQSWTQDVESFRESAMSFQPAPDDVAVCVDFLEPIRRLADRIPPLQARGSHLLQVVCADPDSDRNGREPFIAGTAAVVDTLPSLRVPTNGYLFEMALTIYLDDCKKRSRQKRGGSGFQSASELTDIVDGSHPIVQLGAEFEASLEVEDYEPSVDPMRQFEDQELFEKFYLYLRKPLDAATAEYQRAQSKGHATAELKRLESLSNKFARSIAVLTLLGEGYTQEQAADRLSLSRNQVKYIVELVQGAFDHFTKSTETREVRVASAGVQSRE